MYKYKGMIQDCHVKWWTIDNHQEYKIIMHTHNKEERKKSHHYTNGKLWPLYTYYYNYFAKTFYSVLII